MSCEIFANTREIACKASNGKTIAAMPDVCFTPPDKVPASPPGIPVPYPNTGMASDTTKGSKKVLIKNKEIVLKNKSYFKKSVGDEAGAAQKKGIITSKNRGKVHFQSWSMDVKVEGKNVARHLDMTTNNHASMPGDTPPWPFAASMEIDDDGYSNDPCRDDKKKEEKACGKHKKDREKECADANCQTAQACKLVPYGGGGSPNCCPGVTGHHMIEDHWVQGVAGFEMAHGRKGKNAAPTVCVNGGRFEKEHGEMHMVQGLLEESFMPDGVNGDIPWDYSAGKSATLLAHSMTFDASDCEPGCLEKQLDSFYGGGDDSRALQPPSKQALAKNDKGDGRWLRSEAEVSLNGAIAKVGSKLNGTISGIS